MNLTEIIPFEKIETSLGRYLDIKRIHATGGKKILQSNSGDLFGIASSTWNRIVISRRYSVNPMQMADYFQSRDPNLAFAIEQIIGEPLIKEFGASRAHVEHRKKPFVVAESSIAHLFSDEMHFFDIAMADPRYPLQTKARKADIHKYRGFGLLEEVMNNVFAAARERDCHTVTLTAYSIGLTKIFGRFGFQIEDSEAGRQASAFGFGVPMEARV
jgi:hypothetical protein